MATAQKRGFHLPWGGDQRREPEPTGHGPAADAEPSLAARLGVVPDDLGQGPFDLRSSAPVEDAPEATPDAEAAPADALEAVMDTVAPDEVDDTQTPMAAAAPAPARAAPAGAAPAEAAPEPIQPIQAPAGDVETPVDTPTAADAALRTEWPVSDRRSDRATPATRAAAQPAAGPSTRRDNPLMAGLVRAMRDAAKVARDEAVATLRAEAEARTDAVHADSTAAVAALRKTADNDVAAIREWSKAEMARIREETETRIAARKDQLVRETEEHGRSTDDLLARLAATVMAYEAEAAAFFDRLLAEDDPARLAGLAERMPAAPNLDEFGAGVAPDAAVAPDASVAPARRTHAAKAAPVEVDADDTASGGSTAADVTPGEGLPVGQATMDVAHGDVEAEPSETVGAIAEVESANAPEAPVEDAGQVAEAANVTEADDPAAATPDDGLDADAAAAAEAEALAGLDGHTQIIVSGLSSVAAIASFKAGLVHSDGVGAVSVNAGPDGDVVYTVTHGGDTDVRDVLRQMMEFQPRLIADDGSTLVVIAREPAA